MKLLACLSILTFSLAVSASSLPGDWKNSLSTMQGCEEQYTFWELENTPFAYLISEASKEKIALVREYRTIHYGGQVYARPFYVSVADYPHLPPTYELRMTFDFESSLPSLVVSYSGHQFKCDLTWISEKRNQEEYSISNVGSVGH